MVLVEHVFSQRQIVLDFALLGPGQADQCVDEVAHHGGFSRHRRHQLELLELAICLLACFLGHPGGFDLLLEFLEIGALFAIAQFLLDRLDLLVEVILALALFHLPLDAAADALFDLQDVDFMLEQLEQLFQTLGHHEQVEHRLLGLELERQMGCNGVRKATWVVNASDRGQNLRWNLLVELDVLVELLGDRSTQCLNLGRRFTRRVYRRDLGREMLCCFMDFAGLRALHAFDQDFDRAVGQLQHLQDARNASNLEHVLGLGLVLAGSFLSHQHDLAAGFHRRLQGLDGLGTTHKQRDDHVRKHDHITQRQQRQRDRVTG